MRGDKRETYGSEFGRKMRGDTRETYGSEFGRKMPGDKQCPFNSVANYDRESLTEGCRKARLEGWGQAGSAGKQRRTLGCSV